MKRRSFIHPISNGRSWQRRALRVCTFQLLACCEPDTPRGIQKKFLKHENCFSPNNSASPSPSGVRAGKQDPRSSEIIGIPPVDFMGLWIRPWVFKDGKLVKLLGECESWKFPRAVQGYILVSLLRLSAIYVISMYWWRHRHYLIAVDLCLAQYPGVWVFFFNLILLFHFLPLIAHIVLYLGTVGPSILLS